MAAKNEPEETAVVLPTDVLDASLEPSEWVEVRWEGDKADGPTGLQPRAYFEGWGKDKGWVEVKPKK